MLDTVGFPRNGPAHAKALVDGLGQWMERRGFASVSEMKGLLSQQRVVDPSAFARANYIKMLEGWKNPYTLSGV